MSVQLKSLDVHKIYRYAIISLPDVRILLVAFVLLVSAGEEYSGEVFVVGITGVERGECVEVLAVSITGDGSGVCVEAHVSFTGDRRGVCAGDGSCDTVQSSVAAVAVAFSNVSLNLSIY